MEAPAKQLRLGGRIRRLRQEARLTQAQMAERLSISPSYLNLIEHNQRPVTVPVLLKLAQRFDVDLQSLSAEPDSHLTSELMEAFADPLFDGQSLRASDVGDLATSAPHVARAVLTLYQAYRGHRASTSQPASGDGDGTDDTGDDAPVPVGMPTEEVADYLQSRGNHFQELEAAADALRREAALGVAPGAGEVWPQLVELLSARWAVDVEIRPAAAMESALRSYDPTTRRLSLSELLPRPSRTFQLAHQLAHLAAGPLLERLASGAKFTTVEADALARNALANYFAAALVMPYDTFLEAARATRHDVELLERRFGASFEQVCHRLTTLRRPGAEGVPFHLVRVDVAGNISKRFSASGITMPRFGAACPRWNVYDAFATPGLIRTQVSRMPDGATYFCFARTVPPIGRTQFGARPARGPARHAIGIGCPIEAARDLIYADGLALDAPQAIVPIGVSCKTCPRLDCADRALPALHSRFAIDENRRYLSAFMTGGDKPS
jgi:predicted transcriptional regulator/transcriptional regulator with XRE-family HTH domain